MAERRAPRIRFKGFEEDWERRKFSELYEKVSRKNDLTYGKDDIISVANMYFKEDSYITDESYLLTYNIFELGDIAFEGNKSKNYAHGRFVENTIGNGIVSHVFDVFKPIMKPYDLQFWKYAINNEQLMGGILLRSTKASTMMTNLVANDFLQETFLMPTYPEQKKIGAFFQELDNLITLHQRKLEKLKILRKAMLEKMFPKNGTKVPEIRFSGFTEDWEQRKLGEIAEKVSEKNFGMQYSLTLTNSAEFGVIAQRDFFDHDIAKASSLNGYYVVHNEDFVYNPRISVSAPVGPINRNKLGETGVMSPLYTVFRPHDINATYLEYFFKSGYWHKFMNFNGDSGARADRFSIKDQVFFEMPIPFPNPIEQRKIGNYLKRLDSLLSLHQRKLEKLRQIKKSMLERMFV